MEALKSEVIKTGHYRVLSIPFGGPLKGRDLDGQYFSDRTDVKPHWFPQRPVIWHHGLDRTMPVDPLVGQSEGMTKAREGWWSDLWLDKQHAYFAEIDKMIQSNRLYGSSGSLNHLVKASASGEILVWPHVEQTLSPVPRNPYSIVRATKALSDFEAAGIRSDMLDLLQHLEEMGSDLRLVTSETGDGVAAKAVDEALLRELANLDTIVERITSNGAVS
jgi:hypothetical protein